MVRMEGLSPQYLPKHSLWPTVRILMAVVILTAIFMVLGLLFLPKLYSVSAVASAQAANELIALSTLLYAIAAFLYTVIVAVSAYLIYGQVQAARHQVEASVYLTISKDYRSREMMDALKVLHKRRHTNVSVASFLRNDRNDQRRRLVAHFWHTIGTLVDRGVLDLQSLRAMFIHAPSAAWRVLEPLEVEKSFMILMEDAPRPITARRKREYRERAEREVAACPAARLAKQWDREYP